MVEGDHGSSKLSSDFHRDRYKLASAHFVFQKLLPPGHQLSMTASLSPPHSLFTCHLLLLLKYTLVIANNFMWIPNSSFPQIALFVRSVYFFFINLAWLSHDSVTVIAVPAQLPCLPRQCIYCKCRKQNGSHNQTQLKLNLIKWCILHFSS